MNSQINLLFATIAVTASATAATISFSQPSPPSGITTPITVKATGITRLERDVKAEGTFEIQKDGQGRVVNTNVLVNNFNNNLPQIPSGSVGWSSESGNTYTFTLSAGGNPGKWDPKQNYCETVYVDKKKIGKNCTSSTSYWNPTLVKGIELSQGAKIAVNFSYK
ncbi:hypothetical protein [Candidatus Sororendozoicomonas aggregata]|uniref:hypothetical protein n=1 Tax=Candidatus Sororendozoicomonas aggregata TaxID=3073239 RepID=UPI002ED0874F